jgi:hypothetical protein
MKTKISIPKILTVAGAMALVVGFGVWDSKKAHVAASSHREAPLIANDPLADNTDLYAFRSPDDTNTVTIIANYIPFELPQGGPNYNSFGENIHYEIHIKNEDSSATGDDITYRFTFTQTNQDPTTFFNIRLGKQNLMTTYVAEKSVMGGPFTTIVASGTVPPPNIGPRSIDSAVGLGVANYDGLVTAAIATATGGGGEKIYCGPADDPFFVDLGGVFDVGETRNGGKGMYAPEDGCACKNVHTIAIKIPISTLQWHHLGIDSAKTILDPRFVIGVWASASRPQIRTWNTNGTIKDSGVWVQVSRLGMPLTNEVITPIGNKDRWNSLTPYTEDPTMDTFFCRPELGLYMDNTAFGGAVPALAKLRIQRNSLGSFGFGDNQQGLYPLYATNAGAGTALDTNGYGKYLLRKNSPRSADLLPIFHTGVPNAPPYQLATGKVVNNPLSVGKPFINNFLPVIGDMLRLNMAVPVTPRTSPDFSSEGLVQAAVLGLTDSRFNLTSTLQFIPNMDGFPNGRRLEDDVTRIELQAVSGVVLAAIGVWYDDYTGSGSPVTPDLLNVLGYSTGVNKNDTTFKTTFPYVQDPWSGFGRCGGSNVNMPTGIFGFGMGVSSPVVAMAQNYPNPFNSYTNFKIHISTRINVSLYVYDLSGRRIATIINNEIKEPGDYQCTWNTGGKVAPGIYLATLTTGETIVQTLKMSFVR